MEYIAMHCDALATVTNGVRVHISKVTHAFLSDAVVLKTKGKDLDLC